MSYNLTDNQKNLVKWFVQQVRNGNLSEEFVVVWAQQGTLISGYKGDHPTITKGILSALVAAEMLTCEMHETVARCILTGKAYEVADSDFKAPDTFLSTTHIFLCYAREDEERVEDLYQKLSAAGFKPWMAKKDILPGEIWRLSIQEAIRRSDFFLACLSANSVDKRGFIQREIKDALDIWREKLESDIYLIPVRMEDCEVPESLRDFQWVNLFEEDGWIRLVKAIQVGMARRAEVTKPTPEKDLERVHQELSEASRESWPGPGFIGSGPREAEARKLLAEATNNTYQAVMDWQERFVYYLLLKSGGRVESYDFLEFAYKEFVSIFPNPKPAWKTRVLSALGELRLKGFIKAPPDFTPGTEIAIVRPFPHAWREKKP